MKASNNSRVANEVIKLERKKDQDAQCEITVKDIGKIHPTVYHNFTLKIKSPFEAGALTLKNARYFEDTGVVETPRVFGFKANLTKAVQQKVAKACKSLLSSAKAISETIDVGETSTPTLEADALDGFTTPEVEGQTITPTEILSAVTNAALTSVTNALTPTATKKKGKKKKKFNKKRINQYKKEVR